MTVQRSITAVIGAGAISAATHVFGLTSAWSKPNIDMEGGAPVTVARLGDSFRDVAVGALTALEADEVEHAEPVEDTQTYLDAQDHAEPVEPVHQTPVKTNAQAKSAPQDQQTELEHATVSDATQTVAPKPIAAAPTPTQTETSKTAERARSMPPNTSVVQLKPDTAAASEGAVPVTPSLSSLDPIEALKAPNPTSAKPVQLAALQPVEPLVSTSTPSSQSTLRTLQAEPNADETAPQLSKRPSKRPREITKAAPKPVAKPKPKPKPKQTVKAVPKGNGQTAESAGTANGAKTAKANQAGEKPGKRAKQSGNAAVSNYPGQVMRKIQRRKPRTNIRGTAVVSFSIAANGGLARLTLVQSSGSPALDKLALAAVQRAAPFPKPPAGAQRSFRLPVKGR